MTSRRGSAPAEAFGQFQYPTPPLRISDPAVVADYHRALDALGKPAEGHS